jgi:hypothetical protein
MRVMFVIKQNAVFYIAGVRKGPRSALAEWEFEEHKMRMRTLKITHECEEERLSKMKLEIKFIEELYQEKLKMIDDDV